MTSNQKYVVTVDAINGDRGFGGTGQTVDLHFSGKVYNLRIGDQVTIHATPDETAAAVVCKHDGDTRTVTIGGIDFEVCLWCFWGRPVTIRLTPDVASASQEGK